MTRGDVYRSEMFNKTYSDSDIERLFSGIDPEDEHLARLAPVLAMLHSERPQTLSEETLARLAAEAAEAARTTPHEQGKADPSAPRGRPNRLASSLRRKLATLATALLTFAGMTGVAFAADGAAPGDTLYGIDRALERIGINDGGTAERIEEANTLATNGHVPGAINHLVDTIDQQQIGNDSGDVAQAAETLRRAASQVETDVGSARSQEVHNAVASMLEQMAEMFGDSEIDGSEFGQHIADLARQIHGAGPLEDGGPPGDPAPNVNDGDGQGPPEDAGPPQNPGSPGNTSGRP